MRNILTIIALLFSLNALLSGEPDVVLPLNQLSLSDLEHLLDETDSELEQLASFTLRGSVGSPGYRSETHITADDKEWIRIELGETLTVDQVVLVPTLVRDSRAGLQSEGFPEAFRIIAGTDQSEHVVATISREANLLPRIAPLAVSFPPTDASWIRIEITTLSQSLTSSKYLLRLSEILIFSGLENVALQQPVFVSSPHQKLDAIQHRRFLTDGFTPYLMDAAHGSRSPTRLISVESAKPPPILSIDLKKEYPINQINLHTAGISLTIPMMNFDSWAVPRHLRIVGANLPDFSDQKTLFENEQQSIFDNGPIIMERFPETPCRYIGITILDHHPVVALDDTLPEIGFSEIEVLSKGRNVAQHAPVSISSGLSSEDQTLRRITDGHNYYGKILNTRDWTNQLARRHDLETKRPLIVAELNRLYENQRTKLRIMSWLAALLVLGVAFATLFIRFIHLRQMTQYKERFAADLHDEIGANLHTIGLLSDLAKEYQDSPEELSEYLERIRKVTERSGEAVSNVTALHESNELFTGLKSDMLRAARRIVPQLEHDFTIEGEEHLPTLKPRTHVDLFLFYKESLINICRHSGATQLSTQLTASPKEITLTISDNGHGIPESVEDGVPHSLKRRARLLKANISIESPNSSGTKIILKIRTKRWGQRSSSSNRKSEST